MRLLRNIVFGFILIFPVLLNAQGNVGIGTSTPQEKLDVNGAIIINGAAAAATPVPGTIQWNAASGYHEGRTSTPSWIKMENDESKLNGDYTTLVGCSYPATVRNNEYTTDATGYFVGDVQNFIENPFGTWWMDDRTQLLYRAADLAAAGLCAGDITAIGFYVVTPGALSMNSFNISMKTTTTASLTTYLTGLTTVYSVALYTPFAGSNDFTLSTPIYWNGTDNLVIEVCYDNTAWSTGCTVTEDLDVGYQCAIGYYQDIFAGTLCATATTYITDDLPQLRVFGPPPTPLTGVDDYYKFDDAIVVGDPILFYGATHGAPGSVTAQSVFDDNTLLSDFVFDEYFDKNVKEEDLENCDDYRHLTIGELEEFVSLYRHLPNIPGRDEWEKNGAFSLGELLTDLWVSAEDQALYIKEIYEQSQLIEEQLISNKKLIIKKLNEGIILIKEDVYLSAVTKQKKTAEIENMIVKLNSL